MTITEGSGWGVPSISCGPYWESEHILLTCVIILWPSHLFETVSRILCELCPCFPQRCDEFLFVFGVWTTLFQGGGTEYDCDFSGMAGEGC